ncbi:MAG TPA: hypothetical protein VMH04_13705 [Candidatus Solibacter sp.]|nr:hypothetical protein [Candidatus Solibacter sp.]
MSSLAPIFSTPAIVRFRRGMLGLVIGCLTLVVFLPAASAQCGSALTHSQAVPVLPEAALAQSPNATSAANKASNPPTQASIVGLWQVNFFSSGQVVDVAFDTWHSDGTELLNDYTNPINGNVCMGAWTQADSATYKLKHPSWYFDNSGTLLGTEMIHETVQVSQDNNHYAGTYLIDVYDTEGNLLATFGGTIKASRITP